MAVDEDRCRELMTTGAPVDDVLKLMRDGGASRMESIRLLVELGMPLAGAKPAVHLSPVWADLRESTDSFHEDMARELEGLTDESGRFLPVEPN